MSTSRKPLLANAVKSVLDDKKTEDLEIIKTLRSIAIEIAEEGNSIILNNFDECLYLAKILPSKYWNDNQHPSHEEWLKAIENDLRGLDLRQTGSAASIGKEITDPDQWLDNPEILFFAILSKGMDSMINVYKDLQKSEDPETLKDVMKQYFKEKLAADKEYGNYSDDLAGWKPKKTVDDALTSYLNSYRKNIFEDNGAPGRIIDQYSELIKQASPDELAHTKMMCMEKFFEAMYVNPPIIVEMEELFSNLFLDPSQKEAVEIIEKMMHLYEKNMDIFAASEFGKLFEKDELRTYFDSTRDQLIKKILDIAGYPPNKYEFVLMQTDKDLKEAKPEINQLVIMPCENDSLKYKLVLPNGSIEELTLTQDELKAEFRNLYGKFSEALHNKDADKLNEYVPDILNILSEKEQVPKDYENFLKEYHDALKQEAKSTLLKTMFIERKGISEPNEKKEMTSKPESEVSRRMSRS